MYCVCIGIDIIEVKHLCNCIYSSKVSASMCARTIFAFAASLHKYRSTTVLIIIIITITYFMRGEDSSGQRGYISTFTPVPLHINNRIRARRPQIKKWFRAGKRACPESEPWIGSHQPVSIIWMGMTAYRWHFYFELIMPIDDLTGEVVGILYVDRNSKGSSPNLESKSDWKARIWATHEVSVPYL